MQRDGVHLDDASFEELTVVADRAHAVVRREHAKRLCDGHFPDDPIVPGAHLAGLMAEVATALLARRAPPGPSREANADSPRLLAIHNCVFSRRVVPHESITIAARLAVAAAGELWIDAEVRTRGVRAARATFRFAECV